MQDSPNLPMPTNEAERLNSLQEYHILDTLPEAEFDRLTKLAAIICGVPIALVSLVDEKRQWFKSRVGLDATETPRDISFCQYAIVGDELFQVEDALKDPRFKNNPLVVGAPDIRFYAGYPLIEPDGFALGTLCIIDNKPRKLDQQQMLALELLAKQVVTQIMVRKQNRSLLEFSMLINYSIDIICIAGTDGYFKQVNKAFSNILGWTENELLEARFVDLIHPEDVQASQNEIDKLSMGLPTLSFNTRFRTVNNEYRTISWVANPEMETGRIFAIGRDVTDSITRDVEYKKSVLETENIRRALDESAIVAITDASGKIISVNDKFCSISGYSKEELIGKDHRIVNSKFHSKEFMQNLWFTIKSGKVFRGEIKNKTKNGEYYWVDTTIVPLLGADGKPEQFIAIRSDITERKNAELQLRDSELKYRAFFENTLALMFKHDLDGNITNVNESTALALGYSIEELNRKKISDLLPPADVSEGYNDYISRLRKNGDASGIFTVLNASGERRIWEYNNALVQKESGEVSVLCSSLDITDRHKFSEELKKANDVANNSLKAKDLFLANMSHEIRTPMNAIIGFSDVLKETKLDHEQAEFVDLIKSAGENLMVIINDILDFSKIEAGHLKLERIPVSLRSAMNSAKKQMSLRAIDKQIKLSFFVESDIPDAVLADPVRINQILINLIGNALKFTQSGKVDVYCNLVTSTPEDAVIEFKIIDTGIGISPDKLDAIFERFQQADDNTTRKYGGTGLGLSITRKLVELFGGNIDVESELGKGSTFVVTLPFKKSELKIHSTHDQIKNNQTILPACRVLLVEDNEMNQKLALKVLTNAGIVAELATNGRIAIEKLEKNEFDVVLMDLQMPEMDGYVATSYIRNVLKNNVYIIAMTAHSLVGEQDKCIKIGMNDYLAKPFKASDLIDKISSHVNNLTKEIKPVVLETQLDKPNFDLKDLISLSNGDTKFVEESISIFKRTIHEDIKKIGTAMESNDNMMMERMAHKMKSSYAIIGATNAVNICSWLENSTGLPSEQVLSKIDQLRKETETIINDIGK